MNISLPEDGEVMAAGSCLTAGLVSWANKVDPPRSTIANRQIESRTVMEPSTGRRASTLRFHRLRVLRALCGIHLNPKATGLPRETRARAALSIDLRT